ncbi:hypothetical protein CAPTEDRAFT_195133 [Capitella teleta]|uniref:Cadherin domain-containing protein n=1 Tax=Capitella teleta TaxID=283909 RepID=R7VEA3_CAPTE|nr:hypothetical protein CAPTEDRAFT_195133 [Capitella teleta]|eukprot:ELU16902.1 hypothetical protein CAPTEDRAFT_195133 [Capitella teleta]
MRSFLDIALLPLLLISGLSSPGRGQLHYEVKEEVAIGSLIADIVLDAKLTQKYDSQTLGALRYQFLTRPTANLTVDNRTGMITTNGRLDRDALCPSADICSVPLDIAIQPVKYFQIIKATVDITDINDNDPVFPDPVMTFEVLESAQPGTIAFAVSEAEDVDNQSNSVQSYELLTKGSDAWRLKVDEHPDGARDVRIVLTETLDREAIPEFHLEIIAYDGGSSPRSGTASIVILVEDANDNVPVFEQTSYEVSIDENIPLMTTVIQLTAFDADSGTNSDITYSMSSRSEKQFGHLFGVNDSTGQVYVKGPVDYEVGSAYNLNIIARDNGPGSIPTSANLLINIRDLNDHYPHLTINTLSARDTNRSSVPEDAQVGTFVAHVIVKDPDAGLNGQFNCSLEDNAFQLKQTYPEEFHVVTEIKLDRESRAEYSLVIKCTDRGTNPKTTQKSLTIAVDDVNDNPPVFSANMYNADLFENNYLGAFIVKMNATDADLGRNAQITYKLDHKDLAKFEIDSVTGIVKARETLDREEKGEYLLTVTAVDNGHPDQLSSSTSLRVWILDVNDEKPQFTSSVYSLGVLENQEPGTQVGFLDAIDGDKSPYNKHYYYLLPRGSLSDAFEVNRDTGEVTTTRRLDREEHKIYELIAVARDTNGPVLSSTATLSIHVMDLNDNPPQFTFPSADNNTVFMSHKVPLGFIVAQIHADDADLGSNGRVKYQLIQGNNDAVFSIDPTLGVLSINVDLSDQPDNRTWHLHVRATDHGDEPLSTTRVIRVVVKHSLTAGAGHGDKRTMLSGTNFIIVIAVGCISGALIVVLLLVIIILLRKQQVKRNRMQRYNCRVQALQKLAAQEALSGDSTPGGGSVRRGGADGLTDHSGCTGTFPGKINLSHEKSRQWLATLEANAYEVSPLHYLAFLEPALCLSVHPWAVLPAKLAGFVKTQDSLKQSGAALSKRHP